MGQKRIAKLVWFGRAGDTVEYGGGCHSSGYGSPEKPHAAATAGKGDDFVIPDGCPVLDKRPALDTPEGYRFVYSGPMVNVDLAPGEVDRIGDISDSIVAQAVMAEPGNGFGPLAAYSIAQTKAKAKATYNSLDHVDTATYVRLWKELGARTGHYQGGIIVWDA
jgi:hypothetical protein